VIAESVAHKDADAIAGRAEYDMLAPDRIAQEKERGRPPRESRVWRDALLRRLLALADFVSVLVASISLGLLGSGAWDQAFYAAVLAPLWIVLAKLAGLYDRDQRALRHLTVDEAPSLFIWSFVGVALTALLLEPLPASSLLLSDAIRMLVIVYASVLVLRAVVRALWRRLTPPERTLIVGDGALAAAMRRKLELFRDIHVRVIDADTGPTPDELVAERMDLDDVDRIIIASQVIDESSIRSLLPLCRSNHVKVSVVPPLRGMFGTAAKLNYVADLPLIEYNCWDLSRSTLFLKRALDVSVSALGLILLAPVFVVVAVAIKLDTPGPVFFTQWRSGLGGEAFRMVKFRTMVSNAEALLEDLIRFDELDEPVFKLERDPRVTRVGRFLRRTSLDELPQLINIMRGEMSLVGPRPEQVELVALYGPEHLFRFDVKPGVTGPMQVFGRGQLSFEERLAVEREYVENMSFSRDLRLLALTLPAVIAGRGAF
jgi:exopolysaccharide biosynthesis polyprenyl glycosylphosphotransferase